jgi:hypothetical protein
MRACGIWTWSRSSKAGTQPATPALASETRLGAPVCTRVSGMGMHCTPLKSCRICAAQRSGPSTSFLRCRHSLLERQHSAEGDPGTVAYTGKTRLSFVSQLLRSRTALSVRDGRPGAKRFLLAVVRGRLVFVGEGAIGSRGLVPTPVLKRSWAFRHTPKQSNRWF